ncbi:M48 family metallopeptidase [bacterium]|nr:M48 family metallopeptidase [bacterium]
MKKIFGIFCAIILFALQSNAETTTEWTSETGLIRVEKIGQNLLNKNNLPTEVKFSVLETDEVNAFASGENEICVYTGLLKFVDDDAELAGIIAHEMGHIINHHVAKQSIVSSITSHVISNANISERVRTGAHIANQLSMLKMSRTQEYEADITGIDLMTNAGYNPLAMISVLYKISGNYIDFIETHPSGDKRTMYSYNYITYMYPNKANLGYSTNSFKQFMNYAKPIVSSRNESTKKLAKFNEEQAKLKEKRIKKMNKYKNQYSGWNASYNLLKSLSTNS